MTIKPGVARERLLPASGVTRRPASEAAVPEERQTFVRWTRAS
jgi:hypothetical protein